MSLVNTAKSGVPVLDNYVAGEWRTGDGNGHELINPSNGELVARCGTEGVDFGSALAFARNAGGPGLRALTFAGRAALLGRVAELLASRRDRWFEIARLNSGNTKADAAIDVDGAIGTLKYFARLGAGLGDTKILAEGDPTRLGRDPNFQATHIGVAVKGVAVHINAFNFPAWGLWEKASVSLLAGVPVFAKPATATAWLAQEMVQCVIESGILPEGSLSIACGPAHDLLEGLKFGDVVCFTGSAATGQMVRRHPATVERGVRVNIEADSLNAAILGPDASADSLSFQSFVREVVKEMTAKAGQKCTAIRRVIVPVAQTKAVCEAMSALLAQVNVGDPGNANVGMGPLATLVQRGAIEKGVRTLAASSEVIYQQNPLKVVDADVERGAFVGPTLLQARSESGSHISNELEVFGPVATVIPYGDTNAAFAIAERGGGSLAASVFSADCAFLAQAAVELGPSHGRILLVDPSIENSHTGHGIVMPSCIHGGPGRAGGGEELGAFRGLWFYHQRTAVQASPRTLTTIGQKAVNPAAASA
ncbi:MAG: 3,4-dehydroadipyl-CoA semialdehyde dehydrogenase [Candidatus Acidiferrales bacterium]